MAFNADFDSNLTIPANVGLGKHASVGFGTVNRLSKAKDETNNNQ